MRPAFGKRRIKNDFGTRGHIQPGIGQHFCFELAGLPSGIAQRDQCLVRAVAGGQCVKNIPRQGKLNVVGHRQRTLEIDTIPPGASLDSSRPVNISETVVQLGLTEDEIDDLWERIERLIERVDEGDLAVF